MKGFKTFVKTDDKKQKIQNTAKILANLFTIPSIREAKAHDETLHYWTDPDSPLISWLKGMGIPMPKELPPTFADGGAGRCYFLINHVVKMSANRVEANVAEMLAGRDDVPAPIVAVKYLDSGIYAILQHYVDTVGVPKEMRNAADLMMVMLDDNPEMESYPASESERKNLCIKTIKDNDSDMSLLPHMMTMMDALDSLYKATGFRHDDAGPTNIGMHKGKVVIPDLGPNEPKDFNALKALAQIQANRAKLGLPRWKSI